MVVVVVSLSVCLYFPTGTRLTYTIGIKTYNQHTALMFRDSASLEIKVLAPWLSLILDKTVTSQWLHSFPGLLIWRLYYSFTDGVTFMMKSEFSFNLMC